MKKLFTKFMIAFFVLSIGAVNAQQFNNVDNSLRDKADKVSEFSNHRAGESNNRNDYEVIWHEDFSGVDGGSLPSGWSATHENWFVHNSNYAGGNSAPELVFDWSPETTDNPVVSTSLIDATDASALELIFMHSVDHFDENFDVDVLASINGSDWSLEWYITVSEDLNPHEVVINLDDYAGEEFYIAFRFWGNSFNINNWFIDDVIVAGELDDENDYEVIWNENFTGVDEGSLPTGWSATHENWFVHNSNYAGGNSAPELVFDWSPETTDNPMVSTSLIDAANASALKLIFMQSVDHFDENFDVDVLASTNGSDWSLEWYITVSEDLDPHEVVINLDDYAGEEFYIAFRFWGNSFNINNWFIDDIIVAGVIDDTNIAENLSDQIKLNLYPNPVSNILHIENNEIIDELRVFDITGKMVYSKSVNSTKTTINVNQFRNGFYILQVYTKNNIISSRFNVK